MRPGRSRTLRSATIQGHAAVAAWNRLQATPATLAALEIWRELPSHQPASIYRLEFRGGGPGSVYAKRSETASCRVERTCYEELVPRLPLSSPTFFGALEEGDGTCWLFLEDVGRREFSVRDPAHRALAARWLARLHRSGAKLDAAGRLPEGGPPRYLQHLRDGRERIRRNLGNPGLTDADRKLLGSVLATLDRVEARWDAIARACAVLPETVVHGDFRPKNVRIREEPTGPVLYALDWELAGWGSPVVDLGPARGSYATRLLDPEVYAHALRGHGPALDRAAIERLSLIGSMLRRLAAIDWDSLSLHFEDPMWLLMPITSIRTTHRQIGTGLTRAEAWLR
jgi:thiamine kinase-like enzyme